MTTAKQSSAKQTKRRGWGEGSITRDTKKARTVVQVQAVYNDGSYAGRRTDSTLPLNATPTQCRAAIDALRFKFATMSPPPPKDATGKATVAVPAAQSVADFLYSWFGTTIEGQRGYNTERGYFSNIKNHLVPAIGHLALRDLRAQHLRELYAQLMRPVKDGGKGLSVATTRQVHIIAHGALQLAVSDETLGKNPATGIKLPKRRESTRVTIPVADYERLIAARRTLDTEKGESWTALFLLLFETGCRISELLGLRWSDVAWGDADGGTLHIRGQATRQKGGGVKHGPTKSKKERDVFARGWVMGELRRHRDHQTFRKARLEAKLGTDDNHGAVYKLKWQDLGLVFPTSVGTFCEHTNFRSRVWNPTLEKANLPHYVMHEARHTFATELIEGGFDVTTVQNLLGHASAVTTLAIYSHYDKARAKDQVLKRSGRGPVGPQAAEGTGS